MTEISLYQQIEEAYSAKHQYAEDDPNYEIGKSRYDYMRPLQSTAKLTTEYLEKARKGEDLVGLFGQLAGFCSQLISYRDFESLALLLRLAQEEPEVDVERALTCTMHVIEAMGASIYYLDHDRTTRDLAAPTASDRAATIRNYYSSITDQDLVARLQENWPSELLEK